MSAASKPIALPSSISSTLIDDLLRQIDLPKTLSDPVRERQRAENLDSVKLRIFHAAPAHF
jgi:hypothetical protein